MSGPADPWAAFEHDPRDPALAQLRASDSDRDLVRTALSKAYAEGRLERAEFDERSDQVNHARVLGDLPVLIRDLVPEHPVAAAPLASASSADLRATAERAYRTSRRQAILAFVGPSLICWAIWIAIGLGSGSAGFPWPLIVSAATLVGLIRTLANREEIITAEVRRLEKKRTKQLQGLNRSRSRARLKAQLRPPLPPARRRDPGHDARER